MRKKNVQEARESALASGWKVEGEATETPDESAAQTVTPDELLSGETDASDPALSQHPASAGLSNGALVSLGVFGGLYLIYAWGWFIIAQAYSAVNAQAAAGSGTIGGVLQQIVFWAAPFAPILWFVVSLLVSRGDKTKRLVLLLVLGAVVLMPLPMLIARGA